MAITVTGGVTHGDIDFILAELRKLHDEHGLLEINVSYQRQTRPQIKLVWNSNQSNVDVTEGK